ncbi:MAG: T9SS type A sorting domain-containing protein [Bacteroidota bacterium]
MKKIATGFIFVTIIAGIMFPLYAQSIGTGGSSNHTMVLKDDATASGWGRNILGALGNANTTESTSPVSVVTSGVLSGKTLTKIAMGGHHTISLASDGAVYAWGYNGSGQLGIANTTSKNVPFAVSTSGVLSGKTITQIAAGNDHSIVLASDGTVYTMGENGYGDLGDSSQTNRNVPVAVKTSGALNGKIITQIAGGFDHSLALASDGTVYGWGKNMSGQLGNGGGALYKMPEAVSTSGVLSGKTITQIAAGYNHSLLLASDGTMYTMGHNGYGQLGNASNTDSNVPVAVSTSGVLSGKTITKIAAGADFCIALASDGTVYTWGNNANGQLGDASNTTSNVPVAVSTSGVLSGKTITQIGAGYSHAIALASNGSIFVWGSNIFGQLGIGSHTDYNVPVSASIDPLPVELVSFTAIANNNAVELKWNTATEVNNVGFEIERLKINDKIESSTWEKVGFVEGNGTTSAPKSYSFIDAYVKNKVHYRLKQIDTDGSFSYSQEIEMNIVSTVSEFSLYQNYPNPFNPSTTVSFAVPATSNITLEVVNVLGQTVGTLFSGIAQKDQLYTTLFDGSGLASGIYFSKLSFQGKVQLKKMILTK